MNSSAWLPNERPDQTIEDRILQNEEVESEGNRTQIISPVDYEVEILLERVRILRRRLSTIRLSSLELRVTASESHDGSLVSRKFCVHFRSTNFVACQILDLNRSDLVSFDW